METGRQDSRRERKQLMGRLQARSGRNDSRDGDDKCRVVPSEFKDSRGANSSQGSLAVAMLTITRWTNQRHKCLCSIGGLLLIKQDDSQHDGSSANRIDH